MGKPRVAFFDFTCCEGCQLQVANFGEALLDILSLIDVVEFREVMSEKSDDYDVAIIEGSITTEHGVERIKKIRSIAKVVIAYGSCATIGGINGMKNSFNFDEIKKHVYGDSAKHFNTIATRPVHQVVKVDYFVPGCPVYQPEFVSVLKAALSGLPYKVPDYAVCVECKLNENECMYDKGIGCLGPITKAGCDSWCINNGNICYGCRGMVSNPAKQGQKDVLAKYKISLQDIINKMDMYNKPLELEEKKKNG
ncbi:MAG: cytochrome B [Candidatus Omnitrophota bacterium]